jgi:hypothetical protein
MRILHSHAAARGDCDAGRRWPGRLFLVLLPLLLAACGTLTNPAQPQSGNGAAWQLSGPHSAGQTFVVHHDGLDGVDVALAAPDGGSLPALSFSLRTDPLGGRELASGRVQAGALPADGWLHLAFPPLPRSHGQRYYLEVAWSDGAVAVPLAPANTYPDGAAYRDREAQEAQLAFRLTYDAAASGLGLLRRLVTGLPLAAATGLLFLLPGLALVAWLLPAGAAGGAERLILSAGLSVALFPLILLAARTAGGLKLGPLAAWLLLAASAGLCLWRAWPALRAGAWQTWIMVRGWWSWPVATLGAAALLIFGVRLLVVSSLAAPMWGDSNEHAIIVQLLADHGGLFQSWQPYTPFQTFTIHYGFHAAAVFFHWITGTGSTPAVLVTGQILNGLAALSLYPLAVKLSGRRWAGVAAVIVAGLLSPMPAFYVNWGRYPQLAGQVLLPIALWFLLDAVERPRWDGRRLVLAAIATAGMFLCYYRIALFYAAFAATWWLLHGLAHWRGSLQRWLDSILRIGAVALGTGLLVLPQLLQLSQGYLVEAVGQHVAEPARWPAIVADYQIWRDVNVYSPWPLLVLAAGGLLWASIRRRWALVAVGLWAGLLASLTLASMIRLPGAAMVTSFAVIIAWYIPVALLIGGLVGDLGHGLAVRWRRAGPLVAAGGLLLAGLWGSPQQATIVDRSYEIVSHADQAAMAWIDAHVPADALFLVNGFTVYGDTSVVGADAGWWIPLLAHRQTTMPPQYALLNEMPSQPGYLQRVTRLVIDLRESPPATPEGQRILCENGISHLYVGQAQGRVGSPPPAPLFLPADLAASPAFETLYHQDRVWVFRFDRGLCGG